MIETKAIEEMSVDELRTEIRNRGLASGAALLQHKKAVLVSLLKGEITTLPNTPAKTDSADLADAIAQALQGRIQAGLDEQAVIDLIHKHAKIEKVIKQFNVADRPSVQIEEHTHAKLPEIVDLLAAGFPVYLVGPAGTGKTTIAAQAAKALGLSFTFNSMSGGCSESHLLGRTIPDASGNWTYRPSPFVTTYENGGLHLFDEIDSADPNLLTLINAPIDNGFLSLAFENRTIEKHKDTRFICAANTYGLGADRVYVGRNPLDGATLDRFTMAQVEIDYDRELEQSLVNDILVDTPWANKLTEWAWKVRDVINTNKLRRIMSMRSIVRGAMLIQRGKTLDDVKAMYFASWSADEKKRAA